jgi:uncharacterized damage-inducible protein DinB
MSSQLTDSIRRLWAHMKWADELILQALRSAGNNDNAWREYAHILAAEETWLSRLEGRAAITRIWPELDPAQVESLRTQVVNEYDDYIGQIDEAELARLVEYTNSAGTAFRTSCDDILIHVALHGQYHRGKINVYLRESGGKPMPVDYIAYVRGTPAAITPLPFS